MGTASLLAKGGFVMVCVFALGCTVARDTDERAVPRTSTPSPAVPATGTSWPVPDPDGSLRPDLISLEPSRVRPGDGFSVQFLGDEGRGKAFILQEQTESGWTVRYTYVARAGEASDGVWIAAGEAVSYADVADDGPLSVVLPGSLEAGTYRFCTANAGDEYCAPVTVIEDA